MEDKKWDWGFMSYSVKAEKGYLTWKGPGKGASYPIASVQGVQYETGMITATFRFIASGAENDKLVIPKSDKSRKMVEEMNSYITEYKKQNVATNTAQVLPSNMIADELIKLKSLLDAGALSQQEFDQQKTKLLSR